MSNSHKGLLTGNKHPRYGKGSFYKGENNYNWKGGRITASDGYIYLKISEHPNSNSAGYISEHRIVMEKKLGRKLLSEEVVHHIDGGRTNNNANNLMLFDNSNEHLKHHRESKVVKLWVH